MGFYSVWPFFICIGLLLVVAATPLFRGADTPPSTHAHRIATMDGMRGFLALAVVFHHAAIYHRYLYDTVWTGPPSDFFRLLGPVGVALFFMITGFLFWSQLIRMGGRPSWVALYTGRVFRIGPLYLAAIGLMLAIVAERTGFRLHVPAFMLAKEMVRWMSLGLLDGTPVNGYGDAGLLLVGVTWSLQWEWYFYLSLPVLSLITRRKGLHLPFIVLNIAVCQAYLHLYPHPHTRVLAYVMLFLLGMLSGSLRHKGKLLRIPDWAGSSLLILLLFGVFQFDAPSMSTLPQFMLGGILYLIISGVSLFGLLKTRAAIRLGDVSYGIYLLQGLILGAVFRPHFSRTWDQSSVLGHWVLCLVCGVLLIAVATATHMWIERPGILAGKWVVKILKAKMQRYPMLRWLS